MEQIDPMRFDKVEVQECLKYSGFYVICRFLHILAYIIAMQILSWGHFPLYCSVLGTVCQAVAVFLVWRWEHASIPRCQTWCSPSTAMGIALVLDTGLIAMTRLDVQHFILSLAPGIDQMVGPSIKCDLDSHLRQCQQLLQAHSVSTSQVLLFTVTYFVILVLRDSHSLLVSGLCFVVYTATVLTASCASEVTFELTAHIDLWSLVPTLVVSVIAKHKMAASNRLLMNLSEKQNTKLMQEKVVPCQAEFTSEQMVSQSDSNYVFGKPSDSEAKSSHMHSPNLGMADETMPLASVGAMARGHHALPSVSM